MHFSRTFFALLLAAVLMLSPGASSANEAALKQAWHFVDSQQYQSAYDLLAPLESEQAGNPIFDYLLGIAALRSGQPGLALFPLERVMAVQPDYPGARLAMAQAYLKIGDYETARNEFNIAVQNAAVEPAEADKFQRELDRKTIGLMQFGGAVDLSLGYDDNVASVTSDSSIDTPVGVITLDDSLNDIEDGFVRLKGSAWLQKPLSRKYKLLAAASALGRFNESADEQNFSVIEARLGLGNRSRQNRLTAYLFTTSLDRDSDSYQKSLGLLAQWRYKLDSDSQLYSFIRTAELDYTDLDDRDSMLTLISVAYVGKLDATGSPTFYAGFSGGTNNPDSSSGDEFGYSLTGLNTGIELSLSDTLKPYAYASYTQRDFDEDSSIFGNSREDERLTLRLGVEIRQTADWVIIPELRYTDNESNIAINDYQRTLLSVSLRRDFN